MIDIEQIELDFNAFYGDKENENTLLARMHPLIAEVKQLRKQVSRAKEWVRSYFINMSGNFNSLEDKVVYDDFMQQMGMKKK